MKVRVGPSGNIIKGHVLDCAKAPIERALKMYDRQLYITWNPKKVYGWGCWEVRRRPETMTVTGREVLPDGSATIVLLGYKEHRDLNHVLDIPFLNYQAISKVKSMDSWKDDRRGANFGRDFEYAEAKAHEAQDIKSQENLKHAVREYRREIRDLKELVNSGFNPAKLADYWKN